MSGSLSIPLGEQSSSMYRVSRESREREGNDNMNALG